MFFSSARARSLEHECYQLIVTINLYVPTIIIIFIMLSTFIVCRFFVCFRVFFGSEGEREKDVFCGAALVMIIIINY